MSRRTDSATPLADAHDRRVARWCALGLVVFWLCAGLLAACFHPAKAAEVRVPERCRQYQRQLVAEAHNVIGLNAPIAALAAQIHQESGCRSDARSAVGAVGLTQFMPATAGDLARQYPQELGALDPLSAPWAIGAQVRYMRDLMRARSRRDGYTLGECEAWWLALKDYNGGSGWTERQRRAAANAGLDRNDAPALEAFRAGRSIPAHAENSAYPRRILITIQPAYVAAAWGRGVRCPEVTL